MDIQAAINIARTTAQQGDDRKAQMILRKVIQVEPNNTEAWLLLADVVGDPDRTQQCLERVLKLDPGNAAAQQKLQELNDPFADLNSFADADSFAETDSVADSSSFVDSAPPSQVESEPVQPESEPELLDFSNLYAEPERESQPASPPKTPQVPEPEHKPGTPRWERPLSSEPPSLDQSNQTADGSQPLDDDFFGQTGIEGAPSPSKTPSASPQSRPRQPQKRKRPPQKKKSNTLEIILVTAFVLICVCILGALYLGSKYPDGIIPAEPTIQTEDPRNQVIRNINASNAEDVAAYMATIHPDSRHYNSTEQQIKEVFRDYDLSYRISGLNVLEQDSREARVAFTLTTLKVSGGPFRDNRITGVFILRIDDGVWKIYDQEIDEDNITYLE